MQHHCYVFPKKIHYGGIQNRIFCSSEKCDDHCVTPLGQATFLFRLAGFEPFPADAMATPGIYFDNELK
jgi:hypothetical protein